MNGMTPQRARESLAALLLLVSLTLSHLTPFSACSAAAAPPQDTGAATRIDPGPWNQQHLTLAADSLGTLYAAWEDYRTDNTPHVRFAICPVGGAWGPSAKVDPPSTEAQTAPRLAVDGAGNLFAVWRDARGSAPQTYFAYRPAGGAWSATQAISPTAEAQWDPFIAVNHRGEAVVAWGQGTGGLQDVWAAVRAPGGPFGAAQRLSTQTVWYPWPSAAMDDWGRAYALWAGGEQVLFALRPAGGPWSAPENILDVPGRGSYTARLAVDSAGNAHAVWGDWRSQVKSQLYAAYRPAGGPSDLPIRPGGVARAPVLHVEEQLVSPTGDGGNVGALDPIPAHHRMIPLDRGRQLHEVGCRGAYQTVGVYEGVVAVPPERAANTGENGNCVALGRRPHPQVHPPALHEVPLILDPDHGRRQGVGAARGVNAEHLGHIEALWTIVGVRKTPTAQAEHPPAEAVGGPRRHGDLLIDCRVERLAGLRQGLDVLREEDQAVLPLDLFKAVITTVLGELEVRAVQPRVAVQQHGGPAGRHPAVDPRLRRETQRALEAAVDQRRRAGVSLRTRARALHRSGRQPQPDPEQPQKERSLSVSNQPGTHTLLESVGRSAALRGPFPQDDCHSTPIEQRPQHAGARGIPSRIWGIPSLRDWGIPGGRSLGGGDCPFVPGEIAQRAVVSMSNGKR